MPQYQIIQQLGWLNSIQGSILILFVVLQRRVVEGIAFSGLK